MLNKNTLAVRKVRGQSEVISDQTSDIKEGQEDKTFVFLYCDRNDIL